MPKRLTQFRCNACGDVSPRWQGQCTSCQEWNTFEEEAIVTSGPSNHPETSAQKPTPITDIQLTDTQIFPTNIAELDQVLGQGLVQGGITLLGGEPGIGKSTLALQTAYQLADQGQKVLYISGEESESQLALRAHRLGTISPNLQVYSQIDMLKILDQIKVTQPAVIILDSIQVVFHPNIGSASGSVAQVRQCATELTQLAKQLNSHVIMIGHITKDGSLAGPKVLEHLVDTVLFFEGDRHHDHRVLRCFKNRFSTTQEIGLFQMTKAGLQSLHHSSDILIKNHQTDAPGSMIVPIHQGSRVLLVEIQALVVPTQFGMAKRTFVGIDPNRANLLIATLEKNSTFKLASKDIFLNVIGGLKLQDPSTDLAIMLAIISSLYDQIPPKKLAVLGEVGLTGEVRPVDNIGKRLVELDKMGFSSCLVPEKNELEDVTLKTLRPISVGKVTEAIQQLVRHSAS